MGKAINQESFSESEYLKFSEKVKQDVKALKILLQREHFGQGSTTVGAELEFYLVDDDCHVLPINQIIDDEIQDPQLQVELCRFNLEYNMKPQVLKGRPFSAIKEEMTAALKKVDLAVGKHGGHVVPVGILPTLRECDFQKDMMTDIPRYRVLSRGLKRMSQGPFRIKIGGKEPLELTTYDMTLEGANTSFQFHLRVSPHEFADMYNAVLMMTPVVLALSANSPSLLGHLLWEETRVSLFKQSIERRTFEEGGWRHPARVSFGEGWVRQSAWELFAQAAAIYQPLIPLCSDEDPMNVVKAGGIPQLSEMCLHLGATWPWNRAIYDPNDGGHLRIEMRALPSGPTPIDMVANALFFAGAAYALKDWMGDLLPALPFRYAEHNFYHAAKFGLAAKLIWPSATQNSLKERSVASIVHQLTPYIEEALQKQAVDTDEIVTMMGVIQGRVSDNITGSIWQRKILAQLKERHSNKEAYKLMLKQYIACQKEGKPVCEWSLNV